MHLPPPISFHPADAQPPAMVRVIERAEIHWNRPVFKAPPLDIAPPISDLVSFIEGRRVGFEASKTVG